MEPAPFFKRALGGCCYAQEEAQRMQPPSAAGIQAKPRAALRAGWQKKKNDDVEEVFSDDDDDAASGCWGGRLRRERGARAWPRHVTACVVCGLLTAALLWGKFFIDP